MTSRRTLDDLMRPTILKSSSQPLVSAANKSPDKKTKKKKPEMVVNIPTTPKIFSKTMPDESDFEMRKLPEVDDHEVFCEYLFSRAANTAEERKRFSFDFVRKVRVAHLDDDEEKMKVKPMRFVEAASTERMGLNEFRRSKPLPPKKLTYLRVPKGADYCFKYCGACVFEDLVKCQFCHTSKLSKHHRLPLRRLVSLLLLEKMCARDLGNTLVQYARSDDYCATLNEKLGWEAEVQATCASHAQQRAVTEDDDYERQKFVDDLKMELSDEKTKNVRLFERLGQVTMELEKVKALNLEKDENVDMAMSENLNLKDEIARLKDCCSAQNVVMRCFKEEIELTKRKPTESTSMQTEVFVRCGVENVETQTGYGDARVKDSGMQTDQPIDEEIGPSSSLRQLSSSRRLSSLSARRRSSAASSVRRASVRRISQGPSSSGVKQHTKGVSLLSKLGKTKTADRLIPLTTLLDMIHEVIDKRIVATQAKKKLCQENATIVIEDLVDFVKIYWREKLGLRKLANKRVGEMIRACKAYAKTHSRVMWFSVLLGVKTAKIDQGDHIVDVPFVPWLASAAFDVLANLFSVENKMPGVAELLGNYKVCVVDRSKVVCAIIGSTGVLDASVKYDDPSTWKKLPSLNKMMHPLFIKQLAYDVVETFPEVEAQPLDQKSISTKPKKKGISIDEFLETLLGYQVRAVVDHQRALTSAFHKFDGGEPGLDFDEFSQLCRWCLPPKSVDTMNLKELYGQVEALADVGLVDGENDANINDSLTFPIVLMQQLNTCPLAFAQHCRDYWTAPDINDNENDDTDSDEENTPGAALLLENSVDDIVDRSSPP